MLQYPTWKRVMVLAVCALGVLYALPNFFDRSLFDDLPDWLPGKQVNLGLDLQGGSHLLLQVETGAVLRERLETLVDTVRATLRQAGIQYTGLGIAGDGVAFTLRDPAKFEDARRELRKADTEIEISSEADGGVRLGLSEAAIEERQRHALDQSIEIIRRRVDETGTREPIIQRQGDDRVLVQLPGLDNPDRIKQLLGQTAKLTFHLVDLNGMSAPGVERGRAPAGTMILPSDEIGPDGQPRTYVVNRRVRVGGENLIDAQATFQDNRPVVSFRFDTLGARKFGQTTKESVGQLLAIVLDNKVISAPRINEPILGGSGIISGQFSVQDARDLALLLRAGALPAPLTILEERTVGPGLGRDSIEAGKIASLLGVIFVAVFMVAAYGLFGVMANVALFFNLFLLLALLSILQATLTLPGIAGIVLTVGMAVDANVLVFERIREELRAGRTPFNAVDSGYQRALTTIVDSNLTTLIAATLLFAFGSGPIRGFAVTLTLGIVTSMFTAIMLTRLMVVLWLRRTRPQILVV
ncbi:MAG: protein translocase subunit SecD [Alphaproteobacteria bacterium]